MVQQPAALAAVTARSALARVSLVALALAALCGPARAVLPEATHDDWVEVKSERFTVYSNADEQAAARAARHLEHLAQVLGETTRGLKVDGGREVRVFLFRDLRSFKPYRPSGDDDNGITAGFHVSGPDVELIAYHTPSEGDAMRFASHEYMHAVLARSLGELPVWVNEGLAEFYSTFHAGKRTAVIGTAISEHVAWLRANGTTPIDQLILQNVNSPDYNEGNRRGTIYAQSWALVHMLVMAPGADAARFPKLLGELGRGVDSHAALAHAYGPNACDSLAAALRAYVQRGSYTHTRWRFSADLEEVPTRVRAVPRAEVLTLLGELAARSRRTLAPLAREHLEAAWRADSSNAVAAGVMCELADREGDDATSAGWADAVQRAAGADPRARALAGCALAMKPFSRGYLPSWPPRGADAATLRGRSLLEAANAARPGRVEWLVPYGLTFLDDTTGLRLGVEALMTAHEAAPARSDATSGLSMLQARAGNRAGALALYQQLRKGWRDDEAWRYWAGYLLARRTADDAETWFNAGRHDEAESLLVRLERDVHEVGVKSVADRLLAWMWNMRSAGAAPDAEIETHIARASAPSGGGGHADPRDAGASGVGGDPGVAEGGSGAGAASGASGDDRSSGRAMWAGDARIGRGLAAARRGDYLTAEQQLGLARADAPRSVRAHLDTLCAEVRNQRRMQSARELVRTGRLAEACALYDQVLADVTKADVREYVDRQRERYCHSAPKR